MLPASVLTSADVSIKLAIHLGKPQSHENAAEAFLCVKTKTQTK